MPAITARRVVIATVGLAVLGIGISQIGQGPHLTKITTNQTGILSGTGLTTDPVSMSLSSDGTTITGTGSAGSPFVFNPGSVFVSYFFFGDGADGDCNWDGTTTVDGDAPVTPGATENVHGATKEYELSDWKFCNNATVSSGVAVETLNPIFVRGTLTLNGLIHHNGCQPSANSTECNLGATHSDWLQGSTPSASANSGGISCFRLFNEVDKSSLTNCAANPSANGGAGTAAASIYGCGGGAGGQCIGTLSGSSPKATGTVSSIGTDLQMADGYCSFLAGLSGACCVGSSGGGDGIAGASVAGAGGGGAGHVVVHAYKIVGSGSIEAIGGNGWTYTVTNACPGGGGGGGGGFIALVIGSGAYPTMSVAGGTGAAGTHCNTCNSGGTPGTGGTGANGYQGFIKKWRLGLP